MPTRLTDWLGRAAGWRGLARTVGLAMSSFAVANAGVRIAAGGESWTAVTAARVLVLGVAGIMLATDRGGRWLGIVGVGVYLLAGVPYVLGDPTLALWTPVRALVLALRG